ncbi:MAG TPA: hypothetical protein VLI90_06845 [Tepidisphaeraceae bacterium]|nr:hypothetical protein [Tepidisphaeraceae bacterium]
MNSATPAVLFADQMKLAADSKATVMALRQVVPSLALDLKNARLDVLQLAKSPANIALVNALHNHAYQFGAMLLVDYNKLIALSTRAMNKVMVDGFKLKLKPTDTTLQAKLQADMVAFATAVVGPSAKFAADMTAAGTTLATDAAALAAANPTVTKLATDLQQLQGDAGTAFSKVQIALAQGGADLNQFVTDLTT